MEPESEFKSFVSGGEAGSKRGRMSKKYLLIGVVAAVVLLVGGAVWMIVSGGNEQAEVAAKQIAGPTANINMDGINPATIKVKRGQEITWVNQDTRPHRLTADQATLSGYDSVDTLLTGDSYTFTFDKSGTFHYYDPADPKAYTGTVIVE